MDKNLIKFYIFFAILASLFICIFPRLFWHINNVVDYVRVRTEMLFEKEKIFDVNIDSNKANVLIVMDDGWSTQYTVGFKYMNKKNIRGSIAVIGSKVGTLNYLNLGQIAQMYNNGWDMLNHTYCHYDLNKENYKTQENDILKGKKWLESHSFKRGSNILVYPYGSYNYNTIRLMVKYNILSGRLVDGVYEDKIPTNLYSIRANIIYSNMKVEEAEGLIDCAIKNNLTVILVFHKLEKVTDTSDMQYPVDKFYKIIDYLDKRRNEINIITYSEWITQIEIYSN